MREGVGAGHLLRGAQLYRLDQVVSTTPETTKVHKVTKILLQNTKVTKVLLHVTKVVKVLLQVTKVTKVHSDVHCTSDDQTLTIH